MWHGYLGTENPGLGVGQRAVIVEELRRLGPESNRQPAKLNHWPTWEQSGDECRAYIALNAALWEETA